MRVLVAVAAFDGLSSGEVGRRIGAGWSSASVQVLPVGEAGEGFVRAYAEQLGGAPALSTVPGRVGTEVALWSGHAVGGLRSGRTGTAAPSGTSSTALGTLLADLLDHPVEQITLDLVLPGVADGGAGLLSALGAVADVPLDRGVDALHGLDAIDLRAARDRVAGRSLTGVVPVPESGLVLGGLRGITARRAASSGLTPPPQDRAALLATDVALTRLAELGGVDAQAPGTGACGGVGAAVLALGGRLSTGPALALAGSHPGGPYDLVVTGGDRFDFATRGGGVVSELARAAERWLCPCIVLAREVVIGAREMRTMGVEAAYEVPFAAQLSTVAVRVARSWSW